MFAPLCTRVQKRANIVCRRMTSCFVICMPRFLPESPRWLLTRGERSKAIQELKRTAAVKNAARPDEAARAVIRNARKYGAQVSFLSPFSVMFKPKCKTWWKRHLSAYQRVEYIVMKDFAYLNELGFYFGLRNCGIIPGNPNTLRDVRAASIFGYNSSCWDWRLQK